MDKGTHSGGIQATDGYVVVDDIKSRFNSRRSPDVASPISKPTSAVILVFGLSVA